MDLLELGIAAARAGNKVEARMYLEALTLQEPDNAQGLLWLSFVLDDPNLAMRCLERVLAIDPGNEKAKRGLDWLRQKGRSTGLLTLDHLSDAEWAAAQKALAHSDPHIVVMAIRRLGEAGDARAVEPLIDLLVKTKDKAIQAQARAALIGIGTPSIEPALRRLMTEANPDRAMNLAALPARVHSIGALAACREVIEHAAHPVARYAMAVNLTASSHGEAGLNILRDYVTDNRQDERARMAVLMALGQAVQHKALAADQGVHFLMAIDTESPASIAVRQAALVALGVSNQSPVLEYLHLRASDADPKIRVAAVDALARFTPPSIVILEQLARRTDRAVSARARQILDKLRAARKR